MSDDSQLYATSINRWCSHIAREFRGVGGQFDRLKGRLSDGVWSRDFDLTASQLGMAEKELQTLANEIGSLRQKFLQNVRLVAAE